MRIERSVKFISWTGLKFHRLFKDLLSIPIVQMGKCCNVFKTFLMTDLHLTLITSLRLMVQQKSMYPSKMFTNDNIIKANKFYIRFTVARYKGKKRVAFLKSLSILILDQN